MRKKVFCAFVDLEKAYDSVNRVELWKILKEYGVDEGLVRALRGFYDGSKACVRVNSVMSDVFKIERGVRQGCVMSPWLFNIFMDKCMKETCKGMKGVMFGNVNLRVLLYADDAVVFAESASDLQVSLDRMNERMERMDLKMNVGKTKVVVFDREGEHDDCNIRMRGEVVEQLNEFLYLRRLFQNDGRW